MKNLNSKKSYMYILLFFFFLIPATPAYANVGVPMVFITLPYMIISLIPVILNEAYIVLKILVLPYLRSCKIMTISNLVSTLIGIPITWIILVLLEIFTVGDRALGLGEPATRLMSVTWQAPWLIPYESNLYWMIPSATLTLLVPFFLASWSIEYHVSKMLLRKTDKRILNSAIFNANLTTYIIYLVLTGIWLAEAIYYH